jgi:hypothetical protein
MAGPPTGPTTAEGTGGKTTETLTAVRAAVRHLLVTRIGIPTATPPAGTAGTLRIETLPNETGTATRTVTPTGNANRDATVTVNGSRTTSLTAGSSAGVTGVTAGGTEMRAQR